jgi:hypothetical protein
VHKHSSSDKELRVDYQAIQRQGSVTGDLYVDNLSSGDIIFRGNSYNERMRVLNGGGVLVKGHTSSITSQFEGKGNGDTVNVQLKVKANNGTTSTQGLYGNAGTASTDNTICLGTSGTSGVIVDSAGRVTMPYQPAFSQKGTNTYTWTTTGGLDFTSSNVWASGTTLTNVGGHFNASTGRFTAPVDGAYAITLSVFSSFTSGYFYVYIMKNGVEVTSRNNAQSSGNLGQTLNVILDLSANDYIQAHTESNYTGCSTYRPLFSGFLIG